MNSLQHVSPRVRGIRVSPHSRLQSLAVHITQEIAQGVKKPFKEVIDVSSGDPHKAGMKPISFVHQVLAVCLYPQLLKDKNLPQDVRLRAQRILEVCEGESVGSYTAASGMPHVKQSIAEFIMRRDAGVPSDAKDIVICAGSQRALMIVVKLLTSGEGETPTGVLAPIPCPHTLPMLLDEAGVTLVPYQLMKDRGWAVDLDELQQDLKTAKGRCVPRAIYMSNPGNPTGVPGQCVWTGEFISYKRVLFGMEKEYSETVELISFHSISSACMGECGLRAGYMELVNMDPEVRDFFDTILDTDISTPVTGQLALDLMVNPPKPGDPSYDTYTQEILIFRATLSQNAQLAQKFLNDLPGMSCQPVMGGIYLYPHLCLPCEITERAKILGMEADVLYCQALLEAEGVLLGTSCQYGETTGNHHLRLSMLVPPDTLEDVLARLGSFHRHLMDTFSHCDRGAKDRDTGENTVTQLAALCGEGQIFN